MPPLKDFVSVRIEEYASVLWSAVSPVPYSLVLEIVLESLLESFTLMLILVSIPGILSVFTFTPPPYDVVRPNISSIPGVSSSNINATPESPEEPLTVARIGSTGVNDDDDIFIDDTPDEFDDDDDDDEEADLGDDADDDDDDDEEDFEDEEEELDDDDETEEEEDEDEDS